MPGSANALYGFSFFRLVSWWVIMTKSANYQVGVNLIGLGVGLQGWQIHTLSPISAKMSAVFPLALQP